MKPPFSGSRFVLTTAVAFLSLLSSSAGADNNTVSFTDDGFLRIDGKPRLLLGLYECPKEDAVLKEAAANGFNLVETGADGKELDRVRDAGFYAWINLGRALALAEGDDVAEKALAAKVKDFMGHPALLCWEGPDEALWGEWFACYDWLSQEQPLALAGLIQQSATAHTKEEVTAYEKTLEKAVDFTYRCLWKESEALYDSLWTTLAKGNPHPELRVTERIAAATILGDQLTRGWERVWTIDKSHVFWQNHAPGNALVDLRLFNRGVHAAGCDIYPAPANTGVRHASNGRDLDLTSVGEFTDYMRAAAPGKACWMVLQGFGWTDLKDRFNPIDPEPGRRPTYQESRFMAYDALLHGANALLYWGTYVLEKDGTMWKDLLKVAKELRALEPAIVGVKPPEQPVAIGERNHTAFNGGDPKLILRQVGEDWALLAVNEWRFGLAFDVQGLPLALNGKKLYRLYSDEEVLVQQGGFHDGIPKQDAFIYATTRDFEAK